MQQLNLPSYIFNIKKIKNRLHIFDNIRKCFVRLTPEEWVRQNFMRFFTEELAYPSALMAVEMSLTVNGLQKRCDALLFDQSAKPMIILEFKAPQIEITQAVFDQVAVYNSRLAVDFFIVSNGFVHYFCQIDQENNSYRFLKKFPTYQEFLSENIKKGDHYLPLEFDGRINP